MIPKREGSSPSHKDPPRGRRGRIQEKQSKYDMSVASPCSRHRSQPAVGESSSPNKYTFMSEAIDDEPESRAGRIVEQVQIVDIQEEDPVTVTESTPKRVTLMPCSAQMKNQLCSSNRCMSSASGQLCSCNRRVNNETVVVPQNRRYREDRNSDQIIRIDPPSRKQDYEQSPTLPTPPPRFFRPNAIPQLQRYYWDIGDTTDLEFKFSEQCKTVSSTDVGGFKVWRYWCQTFSMDCTIGDIVIFIEHNIEVPYPEYRLMSKCRDKQEELLPTDWYKTLRCLLLYPKATILILPRQANYAWLKLLISRVLLILLFPVIFLMLVIKCAIAHLVHSWNSMYHYQRADDMSRTMTSALDSREVSSKLSSADFICIKLIKDSQSHRQFTEIYKIVPVPSLFFIGDNGVPMDIIAGDIAVANVSTRVVAAIAKLKVNMPEQGAFTATPVVRTSALPSNSASVSGIEVKRERTPPSTTAPASTPSSNTPSVSSPPTKSVSEVKENHTASAPPEEVVGVKSPPKEVTAEEEKLKAAEMERVQELIKKKREENQKQEEEKEREREMSRRKMGKEIAMAKKTQQERELEELRKERERDRKLEAEARQRVLRQIEEDKANRAARANHALSSAATSTAHNSSLDSQHQTAHRTSLTSQSNEARIQFKLPDGQTRTQSFPTNTTLRDLRSFIDLNIDIPFKEYTLATTFPRREFTSRDLNRDLSDLQLLPSSVLLILPVQGNRSIMKGPGWTATLSAMLWALIQPVLDIGSYLKSLITGSGTDSNGTAVSSESTLSNEQPSTSNSPSTQEPVSRSPFYNSLGGGKSVRKRGNIHSLSDGNDSNDENNTWNGNSTQQM